ncbi:MAG: DNA-processing protein DprA, partial [Synergistales bacterium]|nr:DNA-processing protein DprA [Bacteroidales bacterium]MDY6435180.1 DNA-processing protein DprA [Synergistales bacterium]
MVNIYELALAKTPGIGPRMAVELLNHIGSAEELFRLNRNDLQAIFKSKYKTIDSILNKTMFATCEKELNFVEKYNIRSYFFTDDSYPQRLKNIPDAPICLFVDGKGDLNGKHVVSIVGSRQATDYGRMMTDAIVRELKSFGDIAIISGLAYGIDSMAHRQSLSNNIPTFGVLGHG